MRCSHVAAGWQDLFGNGWVGFMAKHNKRNISGQVVRGRIVGGDEQAKKAKHDDEGEHGAA